MAFVLGDSLDAEIKAAFSKGTVEAGVVEDDVKSLFRQYKRATIKSLNRKWDILSLESYIEQGIIPRGLRERVIPATHLQNERFLEKWKTTCINHGIEVMRLIVEEEKLQLKTIQDEIESIRGKLEPLKEQEDFEKHNDLLKKEVERVQRSLKNTKQSKFQRDLTDWSKGEIFDLNPGNRRGRARSRGNTSRSGSVSGSVQSGSEDDERSVSFLEGDPPEDTAPSPAQKGILKKSVGKGGGGEREGTKGNNVTQNKEQVTRTRNRKR